MITAVNTKAAAAAAVDHLPHPHPFRILLRLKARLRLIEFGQRWLWSKLNNTVSAAVIVVLVLLMSHGKPGVATSVLLISVIQSCALRQSVRVSGWVSQSQVTSSVAIWHQSDGKIAAAGAAGAVAIDWINYQQREWNQKERMNERGGAIYRRAHTSSLITVIGCFWLHCWTRIKSLGFSRLFEAKQLSFRVRGR